MIESLLTLEMVRGVCKYLLQAGRHCYSRANRPAVGGNAVKGAKLQLLQHFQLIKVVECRRFPRYGTPLQDEKYSPYFLTMHYGLRPSVPVWLQWLQVLRRMSLPAYARNRLFSSGLVDSLLLIDTHANYFTYFSQLRDTPLSLNRQNTSKDGGDKKSML